MTDQKVAIIGAGLSGLACALELKKNNISPTLFESTASAGGRVKTDTVDGFQLDHGFQVFLPSYEMGKYFLDYDQLKLNTFSPGAQIWKDGKFYTISDPLRDPSKIITTAFSPIPTLKDKFLTLKLILSAKIEYEKINAGQTAIEFLKDFGFSNQYIQNFFIPFFSGVFLTRALDLPADFFLYLFHNFSKSLASLPDKGMSALPEQMANQIGLENFKFNTEATSEELLSQGFDHVFVCHHHDESDHKGSKLEFLNVTTHYFKTKSAKWAKPTLFLNSSPQSIVNHVACLTAVNKNYSPPGWHLFSVNTLSHSQTLPKSDLINLFGQQEIDNWEHIKSYDVKKALPKNCKYGQMTKKIQSNTSYCGDYLESPSIQGALFSGRKAARNYVQKIK